MAGNMFPGEYEVFDKTIKIYKDKYVIVFNESECGKTLEIPVNEVKRLDPRKISPYAVTASIHNYFVFYMYLAELMYNAALSTCESVPVDHSGYIYGFTVETDCDPRLATHASLLLVDALLWCDGMVGEEHLVDLIDSLQNIDENRAELGMEGGGIGAAPKRFGAEADLEIYPKMKGIIPILRQKYGDQVKIIEEYEYDESEEDYY